ncbi:MFS transporter [Actinospica robiniae]|uniref:MFS transporter n=1 Tax=Actinospica robiniae TaxID=304901 RepID=UPI0003FA4769|nr:MFS transporter [Actinospica robiniae]
MTSTIEASANQTPDPVPAAGAEPGPGAHRVAGTGLILLGVILIAANLRLSVSATGALLDQLGAGLHLSSGIQSLLTAIWPFAFAVGGISGSWLARKYTAGTVIAAALAALTAGQIVHSLHDTTALVAGSVLAGLGIALANVLLPVVVRQYFPDRVGQVTGLYAMVLAGGSAVAALASVPVANAFHAVDAGLAVWVIPSVIGLAAWFAARPQRAAHPSNAVVDSAVPAAHLPLRQIARQPLAWALAALFGLQSVGAYVIMGWLPSILGSAGMSHTAAGAVLSAIFFINIPISYLVPHLGARMKDQRPMLLGLTAASLVGFIGLIIAPASLTWLWVVFFSFGMATFPLVLALFPLRGGTAHGTAALSTFSQSIGYLLAAVVPLSFGMLHDATGSWTAPLLVVVVVTVLQGVVGSYVASPRRGSVS